MTSTLLKSGEFRSVNEDFNLFTDETHTYSPTMYVQYGPCQSDRMYHSQLVSLLQYYQAGDRYWKNRGVQPAEMINAQIV